MRGQTTLDFAVGVSIFLLALTAVFLFLPGTLGPFVEGGQEQIVASNRVAASLAEGLLGDPSTPHLLDTACTVGFFNQTPPSNCRYSGSDLKNITGLSLRQEINVTLQGNLSDDGDGFDLLCWNGDKFQEHDSGCGEVMAIGETPPTAFGTTVTSRRIVEVNDTQVTLLVEMW